MICALPVLLSALGLLASPGAASPVNTTALTRAPVGPNVDAGRVGLGNLTAAPGEPISKRGSKWGKYVTYAGDAFMDEAQWSYWTGDDPTHGKVNYVSLARARELGLIATNPEGQLIMAASSTGTSARGRDSVRIHSRERFGNYLAVLDVAHMPVGKGAWPAFWSNGDDGVRPWPDCGEIDILEGVHDSGRNQFTLHTARGGGCRLQPSAPAFAYSGTFAAHQDRGACDGNLGCSVRNADERGWGAPLNDHQGGFFVTEFGPRGVYHWFYLRQDWPHELRGGWPEQIDTGVFGTPLAAFGGDACDVGKHFTPQQFIFDITFCGDWLASEWAGGDDAARRAQCEGFVMDHNNNAAFRDTYWAINSLVVYTEDGDKDTYTVNALGGEQAGGEGGGEGGGGGGGSGATSSSANEGKDEGPAAHSSSHRPSASCFTLALTLAISLCCL